MLLPKLGGLWWYKYYCTKTYLQFFFYNNIIILSFIGLEQHKRWVKRRQSNFILNLAELSLFEVFIAESSITFCSRLQTPHCLLPKHLHLLLQTLVLLFCWFDLHFYSAGSLLHRHTQQQQKRKCKSFLTSDQCDKMFKAFCFLLIYSIWHHYFYKLFLNIYFYTF